MKNLSIHFCILCLLFCVAIPTLQAQERGRPNLPIDQRPKVGILFGSVQEEGTGTPIEFATITIINPKDSSAVTGGITDGKGNFKITEIPVGRFQVEISFIGYNTYYNSDIRFSPRGAVQVDLGKVNLSLAGIAIEDATVTANKELMKLEIDKRVFDVSQNLTSTGGSANEILENIPSVEVDIDGNVSLRGSQNITILIDGKPSGLTGASRQAILDQIPASSIESVEIITNPSAKYDPDGMGGIINIILKKNKLFGYSGNISLTAATGDNYNGSVGLSKRNDKMNVYGNYSYRYADTFSLRETDRNTFFTDTTSVLNQVGGGYRVNKNHTIGAGFEWYLTPKSTFFINGTYSLRDGNDADSIVFNTFDSFNGEILNPLDYLRRNSEEGDGDNLDLKLGFQHIFESRKKELSVDFAYSESSSQDVSDFTDFNNPDWAFNYNEINETSNDFNFYSGQLDFLNVYNNSWKLETGAKATLREVGNGFRAFSNDFTNGAELLEDDLKTNDFEYDELIFAGYGIVGKSFGDLGIQLGLRAEQALTESFVVTTDTLFENDYFSVFPSGHLKYTLPENKEVMMSYSRRINRPRTRQLNPFTDFSNPNLLRFGNPFLLPEYVDAVELSFSKSSKSFQLVSSLYYRKVNDVISRIVAVEGETSTVSFDNLSNSVNQGLELIFTWKKWKDWSVMLSANGYKTSQDGSNIENDLSNEGYAGNGNMNISWKKNGWSVQGSARYRTPVVILQGEISGFFWADIALKKNILKDKGTLGFRFSDIANTRVFKFSTSGDTFSQEGLRDRESRNLYVTFTYQIGKLEQRKRRSKGNGGGGSNSDGGGEI